MTNYFENAFHFNVFFCWAEIMNEFSELQIYNAKHVKY